MVLFSFSIPDHITKIMSGEKAQTTRQPRKSRKNGAKPYSVGELAQLYYCSRQKPSCHNCIIIDTPDCRQHKGFDNYCKYHSNFFGESIITEIVHYYERGIPDISSFDYWMGCTIGNLDEDERDCWAIADGFPDGFEQANKFFIKSTHDHDWAFKDLDVIHWDGRRVA